MDHIDNAVVRGGKIVLSDLPFAEGEFVRIVVSGVDAQSEKKASIHEIRRLLKGGVERLDDPFEPMIPADHWEMLK